MLDPSLPLADLLARLLPAAPHLRVDARDCAAAVPALSLSLTATQAQPCCPPCHQAAPRTPSRSTRSRADLPWAAISGRRQLHGRTCCCDHPSWPQRSFTERLPSVVAPWARRTARVADQQRHIGLALGGSAGARLGAKLVQPASRNTLLHLIRTTPQADAPTPRVLGVDDWVRPVPSKQVYAWG